MSDGSGSSGRASRRKPPYKERLCSAGLEASACDHADLSGADVVISIGCDLQGLPAPRGTLLNWDEVPALSEDFARADERIRERVIQLEDELARKQQR